MPGRDPGKTSQSTSQMARPGSPDRRGREPRWEQTDLLTSVEGPVYALVEPSAVCWLSGFDVGHAGPATRVTVSHTQPPDAAVTLVRTLLAHRLAEVRDRSEKGLHTAVAEDACLALMTEALPDVLISPGVRWKLEEAAAAAATTIATWAKIPGAVDGRAVTFRTWSFAGRSLALARASDEGFVVVETVGDVPERVPDLERTSARDLLGPWARRPRSDVERLHAAQAAQFPAPSVTEWHEHLRNLL
jgi:hypothetical protein